MTKNIKERSIKFKYENGVTGTGKVKYAYNTIGNISDSVSDEAIFDMLALMVKIQNVASKDVEIYETSVLK